MLQQKTYRIETILIEQPAPSYFVQKKFSRTVEIHLIATEKMNFRYQILVVDFEFSNHDQSTNELIKRVSYLFDELVVLVNQDGNIIGVENINALRTKWIELSSKLTQTYKGETIDNWFSQISFVLTRKEELIRFLSGYDSFGLLFNGLWQPFENELKRSSNEGITEIISLRNHNQKRRITISAENLEEKQIQSYKGIFKYDNQVYQEGLIEIIKKNLHVKYTLLWIT